MLIVLGVAFIVALAVAVLSSKNCMVISIRSFFQLRLNFSVKPKHLVALRVFVCFCSLCQLVMSLNVKKAKHTFSQVGRSHFVFQKSGVADNRPSSITMMFDGVQFFAFSLDIVRPECSVSIDAVLKATLICMLPVATAAMMIIISTLTSVWKSHLLRQMVLKIVPNLNGEMSIQWILYHAFLDAFFVKKAVFHRELK